MRMVFQALYAPVFFFGSLVSGITIIGMGGAFHWLLTVAAIMAAISFLAEQTVPYKREWNKSKGDRLRDALHACVNESSVGLAVAFVPMISAILSFNGLWPETLPIWVQLGLAIIIADIGITLAHYASHRIELLWRLHAPHHSVKRMYGFNGLVKHPGHQAIELVAGTTPLILMGMPLEIAALLSLAVVTQLLLQHSNVDMKIGPLRHIWAVAPVHRFHHMAKAGEGDVNFGLFLTVWDHLLGTAYFDANQTFAADDLGIENQPDYPVTYLEQLKRPFKT